MLRNKQETFMLLEEYLGEHADKIDVCLAIPKQEGVIADDEIGWFDEALVFSADTLNNLDEYDTSIFFDEEVGLFISCVFDDMLLLNIEFGYDHNDEPVYTVTVETVDDYDSNIEIYTRRISRQGDTEEWRYVGEFQYVD
jgi:hypothetical protein